MSSVFKNPKMTSLSKKGIGNSLRNRRFKSLTFVLLCLCKIILRRHERRLCRVLHRADACPHLLRGRRASDGRFGRNRRRGRQIAVSVSGFRIL